MRSTLWSVSALLVGSAALLFAGGINALVLPIRGEAEGFSAVSLGLLGTGWAAGHIMGCLVVPRLVARVGHIRSFSVMAACAGCAVLASLLILSSAAWIVLRAISGFCFAGAAMIVESWLNDRSKPELRGSLFSIYMATGLSASTAGQLILGVSDPKGYEMFVLAAMAYMLAIIPTAVTQSVSPQPLVQSRLDLKELWRNSPVAVGAVLAIGTANSAFGTLAAVYAAQYDYSTGVIALFVSLPVLAGALAQAPIGYLSDLIDRRLVLIAVACAAAAVDLVFVLAPPQSVAGHLVLVSLFGAAMFTMYPLVVAHANDHAAPDARVSTSSGLLLLFGIGSSAGPILAGIGMAVMGGRALFLTTAIAHVVIAVFAVWRMAQRSGVAFARKRPFRFAGIPRLWTPQTVVLAAGRTTNQK